MDDFPIVSPAVLATDPAQCAKEVLQLLGWEIKQPDSLAPAGEFKALGVLISMTEAEATGQLKVRNKPERIEEDRATLGRILEEGQAAPAAARILRGRLQYACTQTFGRCGAFDGRFLRDLAAAKGPERRLTTNEMIAIKWWRDYLGRAAPQARASER